MEFVSLTLGGVQVQAALDSARGLLVLFEADVQRAGGTYQPRERSAPRRNSRSRSRTCSSSSGEWRRSPSPLPRRPPTPPPPPPRRAQPAARGGEVSVPEPAARRFHRGTRAGDRVKTRRNRAAERANPFTAASASTSPFSTGGHGAGTGLFGSTPGPTPFRDACCHRAAPVQAGRSILADRTVQPLTGQVSSSPFFLQPVPQTLPPWLPSWRRRANN